MNQGRTFTAFYGEDLAHAHEHGFAAYWDGSADWLERLARAGNGTPFVVDIGCGDGRMLAELDRRGIDGRGFDVSQAFVDRARSRGLVADVADAKNMVVPAATLIIALGEVLAYEDGCGDIALQNVVSSAAGSLVPGGSLVFDLPGPGMADGTGWHDAEDWMVASRTTIVGHGRLQRRIVVFRRDGHVWRRSDERHRQRMVDSETVETVAQKTGLVAERLDSVAGTKLLPGRLAYLLRKAASP